MTELYLIAHKVRGEPAFDIAQKMEVYPTMADGETFYEEWWIIPTSGHRAYPYWSASLDTIGVCTTDYWEDSQLLDDAVPPIPTNLRDHYEAEAAPRGTGSGTNGRDLLAKLGLLKPIDPIHSIKRSNW